MAITSYDTLRALPRPGAPLPGLRVGHPARTGGPGGVVVAPALVVADEAHYIKNPEAGRTRATAAWMAASPRALLMSGTPLENRVEELVHLVTMVSPSIGADLDGDDQVALVSMPPDQFREHGSPVYLRRNQVDVLHELPERIEVDEWVELTPSDEAAYVAAVADGSAMRMRQAATLGAGARHRARSIPSRRPPAHPARRPTQRRSGPTPISRSRRTGRGRPSSSGWRTCSRSTARTA